MFESYGDRASRIADNAPADNRKSCQGESYQELSFERRLCEFDGFRIQRATDPQRHVQRRDETEATPALVVPITVVWIEREPLAHFLKPAREFPARDDAASTDGARARLFADAHAEPRQRRFFWLRMLLRMRRISQSRAVGTWMMMVLP